MPSRTARRRSSLEGKWWRTAGFETPTSSAISCSEVPSNPWLAKSRVVDATTSHDASIPDATLPLDAPSSLLCIPGVSVACVGPGGCASNQICDVDGTGFFACVCPGDGGSQVCAPGQSVACVGPGGCT